MKLSEFYSLPTISNLHQISYKHENTVFFTTIVIQLNTCLNTVKVFPLGVQCIILLCVWYDLHNMGTMYLLF